jgi:hypothetical protein
MSVRDRVVVRSFTDRDDRIIGTNGDCVAMIAKHPNSSLICVLFVEFPLEIYNR